MALRPWTEMRNTACEKSRERTRRVLARLGRIRWEVRTRSGRITEIPETAELPTRKCGYATPEAGPHGRTWGARSQQPCPRPSLRASTRTLASVVFLVLWPGPAPSRKMARVSGPWRHPRCRFVHCNLGAPKCDSAGNQMCESLYELLRSGSRCQNAHPFTIQHFVALAQHPSTPSDRLRSPVRPGSDGNGRRQIAVQLPFQERRRHAVAMITISAGPALEVAGCCQSIALARIASLARQHEVVPQIQAVP